MKRLIFLICIALLSISTLAQAQNQQTEEEAIKSLFVKFSDGWNKQDGMAMAATYAEDASLIDPMGEEARGREAIANLLNKAVSVFLRESKSDHTVNHIRFLTPDVAFVDATQTVTGALSPDGKTMPDATLHVAVLLLKKDNNWWFVDARPYQFMTPPPAPMPVSEK